MQPKYIFTKPVESVGLVSLKTPMVNCVDGSADCVSVYAAAVGLIHNINQNEAQLSGEFERGESRIVVSRDMFGKDADPVNHNYSPYRLDENGKPVSDERIRYVMGESYHQIRDCKVVLEKHEVRPPYPYIGDQLHKFEAGYCRIGEVIAGAIISAYGN